MLRRALTAAGLGARPLDRGRLPTKLRTLRAYDAPLLENLSYFLTDPELQNFTYELDNEEELGCWLAEVFDVDYPRVCGHLIEARSDQRIYGRLREARPAWQRHEVPPLGRRLGWYAITRLVKPTRIVETGIYDGLGSLVFLAALDRNRKDGIEGDLVSLDVEPRAGWLVGTHPHWSRRIGDARETLGIALSERPTQLFLHDSLHTVEHESFEVQAALSTMDGGVVMSDNSHATTVLRELAAQHGRRYSFFRERPRAHFYPGGGIGVAVH